MNMEIKARDLIAAGWHEGRRLGPALRRARDLESTGLARADVLTALEAEFPKQFAVILPRYEPAPLPLLLYLRRRVGPDEVKQQRPALNSHFAFPVIDRSVKFF
jgi:tRNA-splicing ligase RtcB